MPIEIRYYNNLFWSEGNEKPNRIPTPDKVDTVPRQPTMYDFENGFIKLYGDWNYAVYNGRHYFLEVAYRYDEKKKSYGYAMRLDYWIEALKCNPVLHGILNVSNNDKLLEEHLQYTVPALAEPASSTRINFKESSFTWQEHFTWKQPSLEKLKDFVVAKDLWNNFIRAGINPWVEKFKSNWWPNYYRDSKADAIYIFSHLPKSQLRAGWKFKLFEKIKAFLDDIKKNPNDYHIAKVTTPSTSKLVGKYTITKKRGGIGGGEENVLIDEIDLSGLTGIEEKRITDLEQATITSADFNLKTAIFDFVSDNPADLNYAFKICRKFYGSFAGRNHPNREIRGTGLGSWILDDNKIFDNRQNITIQGKTGIIGFNWGVDTFQQLKFKSQVSGIEEHISHGITYWVDRLNFTLDTSAEGLRRGDYADSLHMKFPIPSYVKETYVNEQIGWTMKNAPGYGFLIYQTMRNWNDWDTIEYTSSQDLTKLDVITGINSSFNTDYSNDQLNKLPRIVDESTGLRGNMGVLLFHLDLYSFLHFTPTVRWTNYGDIAYVDQQFVDAMKMSSLCSSALSWYVIQDVKRDLHEFRSEKSGTLQNPFSDGRYSHWANERLNKLRAVTLQESLTFPQSWQGKISKGDYFFTDLEYALSPIIVRDPSTTALTTFNNWETYPLVNFPTGRLAGITNNRTIAVLGDFVRREGENRQKDFDELNNSFVVCSNKAGEIEIRSCHVFQKEHKLSSHPTQILWSVNKETWKRVNYVKLQKLGITLKPEDHIMDEELQLQLLRKIYEIWGYSFSGEKNEVKWSWISDAELKDGAEDRLFKLVGTEWYCHLKRGQISLISDSEKLFSPKRDKISKLEVIDKLKNLSLLEKINQRNFLSIHTVIRPIKTRFSFDDSSAFNILLTGANPSRFQTGANYYILQAKNKFDVFDREVLEIPKTPEDVVDIATSAQIEQQRLLQRRADQDFDLVTGRLNIQKDRIGENFRRFEWDQNVAKLNSVRSVLSRAPGLGNAISELPRPTTNPELSALAMAYGGAAITAQSVWQSALASSAPFGAALGKVGKQALGMGADLAWDFAVKYPEQTRRAEFDREAAIRELNIQRTTATYANERIKLDSLLRLNEISNVYRRGYVNDTVLMHEMNQKKELNDGQVMKDVHMVVYTPTEEQLKYLVDHKAKHGVDCFIPKQAYEFYFGMNPDVIRFKDLYTEDIKELDNLNLRKIFLSMVYEGIRIVDIKEERFIAAPTEIQVLTTEVQHKEQQVQTLTVENENLVHEVETVTAQVEEEKEKNTTLTTQNQQLTQDKNKLQTDLTAATNRADTLSASVHRLEGELTQEKNVKNLLQAEVNQMRPKVNELTEVKKKNDELTSKIIDLGTKVHNLTNQIAALTNQKITWTYEGDPATGKVNLDQSLHNLDSQLAALGKISTAIKQDKVTQVQSGLCFESQYYKDCFSLLNASWIKLKDVATRINNVKEYEMIELLPLMQILRCQIDVSKFFPNRSLYSSAGSYDGFWTFINYDTSRGYFEELKNEEGFLEIYETWKNFQTHKFTTLRPAGNTREEFVARVNSLTIEEIFEFMKSWFDWTVKVKKFFVAHPERTKTMAWIVDSYLIQTNRNPGWNKGLWFFNRRWISFSGDPTSSGTISYSARNSTRWWTLPIWKLPPGWYE